MTDTLKAFISYKWEGDEVTSWVTRFATDLRTLGVDALLDRWEVGFGDSFSDYMTSGLQRANVVLLVVTPEAIKTIEAIPEKGGALKFEAKLALARQIAGGSFKIIPVLLRGERIPFSLADARYADFRDEQSYQKALLSLVNDLRGDRGKPPLGGTGTLNYDGVILGMLPAIKGSPARAVLAQIETYVGFPFCSYESDHPSAWPPRVFEDRKKFAGRFARLVADRKTRQRITDLASENQEGEVSTRVIGKSGFEDQEEQELTESYVALRSYYAFHLNHDDEKLRSALGELIVDEFLKIERERTFIEEGMPNRYLFVKCVFDGALPLSQVSLELYIHGAIYDMTFDGKRISLLSDIGGRGRVALPTITPEDVHEIRIWYNYLSVSDRWDPKPLDIAAEPGQGVRLFRFHAPGAESKIDRSLSANVAAYEPFKVDFGSLTSLQSIA